MPDNQDDPTVKLVPIQDLKMEEGAEDILDSPEMQPYMRLAMASLQGEDAKKEIEEIAALPLEKRYVWRVASALKWAFADFDSFNVEADRQTLSPEDRARLLDLLKHRPLQFLMFLSALLGEKQMELLVGYAIRKIRQINKSGEERV
jgi:hypothetical protein